MKRTTRTIAVDPHSIDMEIIREAAAVIKAGGLVAFPTETVYGLGASAMDERAVRSIFEAKGRPQDNPVIAHVDGLSGPCGAERAAREIPQLAVRLAEEFWPGPLTLVLPKAPEVPLATTGGLDTVAVRMPDHPVALALIKESGVPLAGPSANLSGKPSPTTAQHVERDLGGRIDMILDSGPTGIGVESTVVDVTGEAPVVLRPGGITLEDLRRVHPGARAFAARHLDPDSPPPSPGMKYTHYSPEADVVVVEGPRRAAVARMRSVVEELLASGKRVGVMALAEDAPAFDPAMGARWERPEAVVFKESGRNGDLVTVSSRLYRLLRELDDRGVDVIVVQGVDRIGLGVAIMNRLDKASGGNVIRVRDSGGQGR